MSVLRKLTVGKSSCSSLFGIPALKKENANYENVHYSKHLFGEPKDYTITDLVPAFMREDGTLAEELQGCYLVKHTDPETNEIYRVGLHVKEGVLTTVADIHGLIWTNPTACSFKAQNELLLFVMGKDKYDEYRESRRIILSHNS